ncbi:Zinc finger protein [Actinidia chinensis var. chinensis]|uniref:Zinc finger protein n=1 Tax=Actinidia chinensis var. chinensis TaxID=1590841 RepID=A0A2R6RKE1_ACTCC|nr:Zinc finger protein [Actinidia chinensis var. chinensis]
MELVQEQKFVCKICGKSCFSGKSLGGHMRGHLPPDSSKKRKNHKKIENLKNSNTGPEADWNASYGLRENPKKSRRGADAKHKISKKHENCIQCEKVFPSLRSLSGHMKAHSIQSREKHKCNKCDKGFDSKKALFGHIRHHSKRPPSESLSDHETFCPVRRKRSRTRYKTNGNFSLCCNLNGFECVSEIGEVEEAAMCLMMMSRGVRNWVNNISVFKSSNSCPETFKAKALDQCKSGKLCFCSGNSSFEKDKPEFDDLDSGNSSFEAETLLKTSGKFLACGADEARKMKELRERLDSGSGNSSFEKEKPEFDDLDSGFLTTDEKNIELERDLVREGEWSHEFGENSCDEINHTTSETFNDSDKKREYHCKTCDKTFHSYQALGGHRSVHKTPTNSGFVGKILTAEMSIETNENSVEQEEIYELKKRKDRECPICFKVFPSGQALGGHKRAHYVGFSENKTKEGILTKQCSELPNVHNTSSDLNVLVTLEEEAGGGFGYKPWWVGSDLGREPLLITN